MIKVEKIDTWGFEHAIRGLRNSMNSWDKSDSWFSTGHDTSYDNEYPTMKNIKGDLLYGTPVLSIGENDLGLMRRLYKAGTSDRKYLRMIGVSMDITAPVYFLREMDTYKVGTTCNSTSLMHTGGKRDFTPDDFSFEDMDAEDAEELLRIVNKYRKRYADDKSEHNLRAIRQSVSMAYNYHITWTSNYEVCATIINQRKDHRLSEWREFCDILLEELPYLGKIMGGDNDSIRGV